MECPSVKRPKPDDPYRRPRVGGGDGLESKMVVNELCSCFRLYYLGKKKTNLFFRYNAPCFPKKTLEKTLQMRPIPDF